ncbi:MAG: DUF1669 domain-containing protein [Chryseotalea sp. WA131a]|nr:MAG: DUF1669 domain-containing protein [Chryseotalea sp. WA131a]
MTVHFRQICRHLINELSDSKEKVSIAVAWFTNDNILDYLMTMLERKIKVELIVVNDRINNRETGLDFNKFIKQGGKFYFADSSSLMHHKFAIIDDKKIVSGSYNWTYNAEFRNDENLIMSNDQELVKCFIQEFDKLKSKSEHQKDKITIQPKINIESDINVFIKTDLINKSKTQERKGNLKESLDTLKKVEQLYTSDSDVKERISEIQNKIENPIYHYHVEDGQFSFDFRDKKLIGEEGKVVRTEDLVGDDRQIYILSIDGFYVECIGNIEREFPVTQEEHQRLKDFYIATNSGD